MEDWIYILPAKSTDSNCTSISFASIDLFQAYKNAVHKWATALVTLERLAANMNPFYSIIQLYCISNEIQRYIAYLYLETALHVSGGTSTHHQKHIRVQLYLQHLVFVTPLLLRATKLYLQHLVFVTPLPLPAAIEAGSSNGVTNTRFCRYICMRSWWWVMVPPETCRAVSR